MPEIKPGLMYWTDPEIDAITVGILQKHKNLDHIEKLRTLLEIETHFMGLTVIDNSIGRVAEKDPKRGFWQLKPEVLKRLEEERAKKT